jgi:putative aldouronate transport system permease protein
MELKVQQEYELMDINKDHLSIKKNYYRSGKSKWKKDLHYNREMLLMCFPVIIKTIIFSYLPMVGIIIAFKDYSPMDGIFGSKWIGLKNFEFFFKSSSAWTVLRNTLGLNALGIVLSTIVNLMLAFLLYEISKKIVLKIYQTLLFIPYFFSWVIVGLVLTVFLSPTNGALTKLLLAFTGNDINFYTKPIYWVIILPLVYIWKGAGFGSLIYYSVLMSIDNEIFEAAEIDGANNLQRIRYISMPFLKPMICVLSIMAVGGIIRADFGLFYFVPRNLSQLFPVTNVIDTFVYRALAENGDFGMSSAVSVFQSVVAFFMVVGTNQIVRMVNKDYSLY